MPTLDVSELNVVLAILGGYAVLYGVISVKIKQHWYLGEALPALLAGIILGPVAARFLDSERWAQGIKDQTPAITLGMARVVIGVQLVMAGYQLPAKYLWTRWRDMAMVLLPIMTLMWLCTSSCILLMIPKLTLLSALVIGSMVTCTDPVLSQAIAKGPFADKYVPRALREIISSEAGANDGFGFPFLLLATLLIRHADNPNLNHDVAQSEITHTGSGHVGRLGGGVGKAMEMWFVEGWLYLILLGAIVGAVCGLVSMFAVSFSLRRKWIDSESLLLFPAMLGLFVIGVAGMTGLDDLLACFIAGAALNWNGEYLSESLRRHDEVNGSLDVILNTGGFMYIGMIIPWSEFNQPDVTGITVGRLMGLGFLVLLFRRIPAVMLLYKAMPKTVKSWKEALFMGYFGPIGIGAVFYVEHSFHLFPHLEDAVTNEEVNLIRAMRPVVYFLVVFSIVVHGLSIPLLEVIYRWQKVEPILEEEPVETRPVSSRSALPNNAFLDRRRGSVVRHNRFSRAPSVASFEDLENQFGQQEWPGSGPPLTFSLSRSRRQSVVDNENNDNRSTHSSSTEVDALESEKQQARSLYEVERSQSMGQPRRSEGGLTWADEAPRERRPGGINAEHLPGGRSI